MNQAAIIRDVIVNKLVEHDVHSACIYVAVLFSDILTQRKIAHKVKACYANARSPTDANAKRSIFHICVEIDGVVYDPCTKADIMSGVASEAIFEYTNEPLYDNDEDEDNKKALLDFFAIYTRHGSEAFWRKQQADVITARISKMRPNHTQEYLDMLEEVIKINNFVIDTKKTCSPKGK